MPTPEQPAPETVDALIADRAATGGSELANTQSFVNGLCALLSVDPPRGSQVDDAANDYVFERLGPAHQFHIVPSCSRATGR